MVKKNPLVHKTPPYRDRSGMHGPEKVGYLWRGTCGDYGVPDDFGESKQAKECRERRRQWYPESEGYVKTAWKWKYVTCPKCLEIKARRETRKKVCHSCEPLQKEVIALKMKLGRARIAKDSAHAHYCSARSALAKEKRERTEDLDRWRKKLHREITGERKLVRAVFGERENG